MSFEQFYQYKQEHTYLKYAAGPGNQLDFFSIQSGQQRDKLDGAKPPRKRRDDTNDVVNRLYRETLIRRPGERDVLRTGGRKNKNEILGLTNARLIKEKHLNGTKYARDMALMRGLQSNVNSGEFVLVLRTDGRIVAMTDEVEHHLGKSMRSLYTQCINIFECLDKTDGEKLRTILDSSADFAHDEHRLVCTFRLPKGKRPSRTQEDIKAISMAGHFYSCRDSSYERLFIARCEALVSRTTKGTSSSQTAMISSTMVKLTLNDDMTVSMVSSNVQDILGYARNEMVGQWFGRYLATNDLEKFEAIRRTHLENIQQTAVNICEMFDMYTSNGDSRLTFLCQIRPTRERRSKSIKYSIVAQMTDPSMRDEYLKYVDGKSGVNPGCIKVEQVNLVSPKTSEDAIVANSPSLAMGLLMSDTLHCADYLSHPRSSSAASLSFARSLSDVVAPFIFDDAPAKLWDHEYEQNLPQASYWPRKMMTDETYIKYQLEQEMANFDALFDEF